MNPTPEEIRAARKGAGLTQAAAADLVRVDRRTWQRWEAGDTAMPGAAWQLFQIKVVPLNHKRASK